MIQDRNKTQLTKAVTSAAARWLDERGFKPVETEVTVDKRWVADLAGVITATETELIGLRLVPRKPSWNSGREKGAAWQSEYERLKPMLWRPMTALVEVKTGMSDYWKDFSPHGPGKDERKAFRDSPTDLRYIATLRSMSGLWRPPGWGALIYDEGCGMLRCVDPPKVTATTVEQQLSVILEIAIRRDHHTRYERHREFQREQRDEHNERKSLTRVTSAIHAIADVANGKWGSVEGALSFHGIKCVPEYLRSDIEKLWRCAVKVETA